MRHFQRSVGRPPAEILKQTAGNSFLQCPLIFLSASFPFFFLALVMEVSSQKSSVVKWVPPAATHTTGLVAHLTTFSFHLLCQRGCIWFCQIPVPCSVILGKEGWLCEFLCLLYLKTHLYSTLMACQISLSGKLDLHKFSIGHGYLPSFALSQFPSPTLPLQGVGVGPAYGLPWIHCPTEVPSAHFWMYRCVETPECSVVTYRCTWVCLWMSNSL